MRYDRLLNATMLALILSNYQHKAKPFISGSPDAIHFYERLIHREVDAGKFPATPPFSVTCNIRTYLEAWALKRWFLRKRHTLESYVCAVVQNAFTMLGVEATWK
jgi:hypothetical protein